MIQDKAVNVIGAGLAGLSAALTLAQNGVTVNLISSMPSERAQSVLAEGGINAALDTMGEGDTVEEHYNDTMKGGCWLESESAVRNLTSMAPETVKYLIDLGVPFNGESGKLTLRNFGGQKKKRTAYAKSSTGKMIMTALIDEVRKYEESGIIKRYPHHELIDIKIENNKLVSVTVADNYNKSAIIFTGSTILCTGGLNGFFEGMTTGTTQNTGNAAAIAFSCGVEFANLEFIQYHPTTVQISGKRMLISEAARGEGGRLYINRGGKPWYFMEEKYPELGNLMPRDVVSREMYFVQHDDSCDGTVYLDMTGISKNTWNNKLPDLRNEIISYLGKNPENTPIPVSPGIHYFMGGIRVNDRHETNISGLYAAGEAACKYHGANRLGGNSMLGAIVGGKIAAETSLENAGNIEIQSAESYITTDSDEKYRILIRDALKDGLDVVRTASGILKSYDILENLYYNKDISEIDRDRARLGLAMLKSASARKESRGAHYRSDYPETKEEYRKQARVKYNGDNILLNFTDSSVQTEAEYNI